MGKPSVTKACPYFLCPSVLSVRPSCPSVLPIPPIPPIKPIPPIIPIIILVSIRLNLSNLPRAL